MEVNGNFFLEFICCIFGFSQGSRTERNREGINSGNSEFILSSRNRCGSRVLGFSKWENKLKETK